MNQPIKLGVSLFSYSSEYYLKKLSLKFLSKPGRRVQKPLKSSPLR